MSLHHLTHSLVREAHQHQRSGECTPTVNRNYDTQVSTAVGWARGVDARQSATKTAPVRPADTWHQTSKWTKTALQGHYQAQHKSLRDDHKYLGASGNGSVQILRFPTQRINASRGDQGGTCDGEAPPSQGSYITRSWRPGIGV